MAETIDVRHRSSGSDASGDNLNSNSGWSRIFAVLLAVGVFALAFGTTRVAAYTLTGYTWAGGVNPLAVCVSNSYGANTTAWNDAKATWDATSTPLYVTSNCSYYQVLLTDTYCSSCSWDGATAASTSGSYYTSVTAYINHYQASGYNSFARESVASHEFGHALGLDHVSMSPQIMVGFTCGQWSRFCYYTVWGPQSDDVAGVNYLY